MAGTLYFKVPAISMKSPQIYTQLYRIYEALKADHFSEAKKLFSAMHITDTSTHLSLPKSTRILIWDLYEYLVIGDTTDVTDKQSIMEKFEHLFSQSETLNI